MGCKFPKPSTNHKQTITYSQVFPSAGRESNLTLRPKHELRRRKGFRGCQPWSPYIPTRTSSRRQLWVRLSRRGRWGQVPHYTRPRLHFVCSPSLLPAPSSARLPSRSLPPHGSENTGTLYHAGACGPIGPLSPAPPRPFVSHLVRLVGRRHFDVTPVADTRGSRQPWPLSRILYCQ